MFINKNVFSVITKNSNWKTLTKNLVIFKRYGVKDETLEYFLGSQKNCWMFRGRWGGTLGHKKNSIEGGIA